MEVCLETSAIIAILLSETEGLSLLSQVVKCSNAHTPASCALEAIIVLVRKQKMTTAHAEELVFGLLTDFDVKITYFDKAALGFAIRGYEAYGKGRGLYPALLNFGDCLSYGTAKAASGELLYTGDDFAGTDLG